MREADFALDLREADAQECAKAGLTSEAALRSGIASTYHYAVEVDGEPVAFWGYGSATLTDDRAYAWLLTRPQIEAHTFRFARASQRLIEHIHESYSEIWCLADDNYRAAYKWLLWLGFLPAGRDEQGLLWMRRTR